MLALVFSLFASVSHAQYAPQIPWPVGSYANSCIQCSFDGRVLRCVCPTSLGRYFPAAFDTYAYPCPVTNDEGHLTCETPNEYPAPPPYYRGY